MKEGTVRHRFHDHGGFLSALGTKWRPHGGKRPFINLVVAGWVKTENLSIGAVCERL